MKRIFVMMLTLCMMAGAACAEAGYVSVTELREQAEALGRWSQTYEAHGRTIAVDVPVIVPEVERVPIVQVSAWMGNDVVEALGLPEAADQTNAGVGVFHEDTNILTDPSEGEHTGENVTVYSPDPEKLDSAFFQTFIHEPITARLGNWGYTSDDYYPYEVNTETIFAEDNPLSLAEAQNALKRLLLRYYGEAAADVEIDYVEVRGRARKKVGTGFDDLGDYKTDYPMGTYCLYYRQKIKGIPIYMEIAAKMLTTGEGNLTREAAEKAWRIRWYDDNNMEFMDASSYCLNAALLKEECMLEMDVPLASVDEVIGRLETEIDEGRLRSVYALRLGYVCYLDENSPDTYTLYPTWVCDCIYTDSPREEIEKPIFSDEFRDDFHYTRILVDAQTCKIQAGWIAEDEGLYHHAPVKWDDL